MPLISIIIPTFNRAASLGACLESLDAQTDVEVDVAGGFEILVVDDGSVDETAAVCARWPQVRYVKQANGGVAAARNRGVEQAAGAWVAFLDDDCRARPGWLGGLWRACAGDEMVLAAGTLVNALPDNPFAEASQSLLDYVHAFYNPAGDEARFVAGANLLLSRARLLAMGGFDEGYHQMGAEDRDLCARWLQGGGSIRVAADAVVDHAHVMGWRGFCRQHYSYGRGAWRFHRQSAGRTGRGMQQAGFYQNMLSHPLRTRGGWRGLRLAGLILLSQVMSTLGYVREAWRGKEEQA